MTKIDEEDLPGSRKEDNETVESRGGIKTESKHYIDTESRRNVETESRRNIDTV